MGVRGAALKITDHWASSLLLPRTLLFDGTQMAWYLCVNATKMGSVCLCVTAHEDDDGARVFTLQSEGKPLKYVPVTQVHEWKVQPLSSRVP